MEHWGERVRRLRRRKGWTQEELAERAEIDRRYVGRLETGEVDDPEPDTVKKLAKALEVPASYFSELLGWVPSDEATDWESAVMRDGRFTDAEKEAIITLGRAALRARSQEQAS